MTAASRLQEQTAESVVLAPPGRRHESLQPLHNEPPERRDRGGRPQLVLQLRRDRPEVGAERQDHRHAPGGGLRQVAHHTTPARPADLTPPDFCRFSKGDEAQAAIADLDGKLLENAMLPLSVRVAEDHGRQKAQYLDNWGMSMHNRGKRRRF